MESAMNKQAKGSAVDAEARRWIFDAVAWLLGIVLTAMLVAEAAASQRDSTFPSGAASLPPSNASRSGTAGDAHDAVAPRLTR
jgi:hypothetical protein